MTNNVKCLKSCIAELDVLLEIEWAACGHSEEYERMLSTQESLIAKLLAMGS